MKLPNWVRYHFLRCPHCGTRLEYWKPIKGFDEPSWYCRKCPTILGLRKDIINS